MPQIRHEVTLTPGPVVVRGNLSSRNKKKRDSPTTCCRRRRAFRSPLWKPKTTTAPSAKAFSRRWATVRAVAAMCLGHDHLTETYGQDDGLHWFERNEQRFDQLIECLAAGEVVPFIGAGISAGGGFPTWANHLRQQGRTAGIPAEQIEVWLAQGQYEAVIAHIEQQHGRDVFAQEIRDVFCRRGSIQDVTLLISALFNDTLITTNTIACWSRCMTLTVRGVCRPSTA